MSLEDALAAQRAASAAKAPPELRAIIVNAMNELIETGIAEQALGVGAAFPAFSLTNAHGNSVSSAELLARGPLVVNFYRGAWCPYCNIELRALQDMLGEIKAEGANLVAISPNLPDNSLSSIEKHGLQFEVLTDAGNSLAQACGLVFKVPEEVQAVYLKMGIQLDAVNGDDSWQLPVPATYVVASDGTVKMAYVDANYTKRGEPADVLAALKAL